MNHSKNLVPADVTLGFLYFISFILATLVVTDELLKFYVFLGFIIFISSAFGIRCRKKGISPIFNNYISIIVAVIGLCLLVHVTEEERHKVRLLNLYKPYKYQLETAKINMELFNIVTQHRDNIRQHLINESQLLPKQYERTTQKCVPIPKHAFVPAEIPQFNRRDVVENLPLLHEFSEEMHCEVKVITIKRIELTDDMSFNEVLEGALHSYGFLTYETDDRQFPLRALLPYSDYIPNSDVWATKKEELEKNLNTSRTSFESLTENYQKIGNDMEIDITRSWKTKDFYLSWWNFFLIIALGYQLNSTIIRRN